MPIRTCLVTGQKKEQKDLLRFTLQEGEVVFDEGKKKNAGRGGYVFPNEENKERLKKIKKSGVLFKKKKGLLTLLEKVL